MNLFIENPDEGVCHRAAREGASFPGYDTITRLEHETMVQFGQLKIKQ